jgi:hypothetical protein
MLWEDLLCPAGPSCSSVRPGTAKFAAWLQREVRQRKEARKLHIFEGFPNHSIFCISDNIFELAFLFRNGCKLSSQFSEMT